jgi:hypothetical protein
MLNDTGLVYFFPSIVLPSEVLADYRKVHNSFLSLFPIDISENILSFNCHLDYVCYLVMLKRLSQHSQKAMSLYWNHLSKSEWSFQRSTVIREIREIGEAPGVNTILYVPEQDKWQVSKSENGLVVKMRLTENTIETCWTSKSCNTFSEIHYSRKQLCALVTAQSLIEEMFGCNIIMNKNDTLSIINSKNRTSDEAAQRVLLHFLEQMKMTQLFNYRKGKVKFQKACAEFDCRMRSVIRDQSMNKYRLLVPECSEEFAPDFRFKSNAEYKPALTDEEYEKFLKESERRYQQMVDDAAREKALEQARYEKEIVKYYRSEYYEVMRELMIKSKMNYKDCIKQAAEFKKHPLAQPLTRDHFDDYTEEYMAMRAQMVKYDRALKDKLIKKQITREEYKADERLIELQKKVKDMAEIRMALFPGAEHYSELVKRYLPNGNETELKNKVESEMRHSRKNSDDYKIVHRVNENIAVLEEELEKAHMIWADTKEEKLAKGKKVSIAHHALRREPPIVIERVHKGRHLSKPLPVLDNSKFIESQLAEQKEKLRVKKSEMIMVKKNPTPRKENLKMLEDWTKERLKSRAEKECLREGYMSEILTAPRDERKKPFTEKQLKSFRYQVNAGMMKEMPTETRYTWTSIWKTVENELTTSTAIAVKSLIMDCKFRLKKSGHHPGLKDLLFTNSEAIGLSFIVTNKKKFLRYVLPNNIANVFIKHYAKKFSSWNLHRYNNRDNFDY